MNVSVIIPVYNEEENIELLAEEMGKLHEAFELLEVLFIDDGSVDSTWKKIQACAKKYENIRGIRTNTNCGQSAAMLTGLFAAKGDILVTMDGDLQIDPADIPTVVNNIKDFDCICGFRAKRRDSWSRRVGFRLANKVRNMVTHDGIIDTGCSLKAFKRKCLHDLPRLNGVHRFMPAYFKLHDRSVTQIAVNHRPRQHGESKYTNMKRLPATIADLKGFSWYRSRYLQQVDYITTD